MTERLKNSMFGILSWMKEHQSVVPTSLDELTDNLDLTRDHMQSQLQTLQRYECVKRGGRGNAEWSITDQGLVRLSEGRFAPSGAFLSVYESSGRSSVNFPATARDVTMITVPMDGPGMTPDTQDPLPSYNLTPLPSEWDLYTRLRPHR